MMTRSPFSSRVSVNLILGKVDGACCANAAAAHASMASSFIKAPDGNTYSTRWHGRGWIGRGWIGGEHECLTDLGNGWLDSFVGQLGKLRATQRVPRLPAQVAGCQPAAG